MRVDSWTRKRASSALLHAAGKAEPHARSWCLGVGLGPHRPAKPGIEVRMLKNMADNGDRLSMFHLARAFLSGRGVDKRDPQKAFELLSSLSTSGSEVAPHVSAALGACYFRGQGTDQNVQKAIQETNKAAQEGFAPAQYTLGSWYMDDSVPSVAKDLNLAKKWFRRASLRGHVMAQFRLGQLMESEAIFRSNALSRLNIKTAHRHQGLNGAAGIRRDFKADKGIPSDKTEAEREDSERRAFSEHEVAEGGTAGRKLREEYLKKAAESSLRFFSLADDQGLEQAHEKCEVLSLCVKGGMLAQPGEHVPATRRTPPGRAGFSSAKELEETHVRVGGGDGDASERRKGFQGDSLAKLGLRLPLVRLACSLKTLNISGLGLRSLPSSIHLLVSLESLNVSKNSLKDLPPRLPHALVSLEIAQNRLGTLPTVLTGLHGLESLDLSRNPLRLLRDSELGAKEPLCLPATLKSLNLSGISCARNSNGFPYWILRLRNLQKLIVDNRFLQDPVVYMLIMGKKIAVYTIETRQEDSKSAQHSPARSPKGSPRLSLASVTGRRKQRVLGAKTSSVAEINAHDDEEQALSGCVSSNIDVAKAAAPM